jgi:hypothetical protein
MLRDEWLNLVLLRGPVRLSDTDINHASKIETSAHRCLTVENETSFHELAKLESGELLFVPATSLEARIRATVPLRIERTRCGADRLIHLTRGLRPSPARATLTTRKPFLIPCCLGDTLSRVCT